MLDAPRELLARALEPLYPPWPPLNPLWPPFELGTSRPPTWLAPVPLAGWVLALGTRALPPPVWPAPPAGLVLAVGARPPAPPAGWVPALGARPPAPPACPVPPAGRVLALGAPSPRAASLAAILVGRRVVRVGRPAPMRRVVLPVVVAAATVVVDLVEIVVVVDDDRIVAVPPAGVAAGAPPDSRPPRHAHREGDEVRARRRWRRVVDGRIGIVGRRAVHYRRTVRPGRRRPQDWWAARRSPSASRRPGYRPSAARSS